MTSTHGDIARALTEGIAGGRYPVGTLLPTEFELCDRFGASRYSVRRALQELQDLGLISRRKNVGTRVESSRPVPGFMQSFATVDELAQYGAAHARTVQSIAAVDLDAALARELDRPAGERWLRISSVRRDGTARALPIGWTDVYVEAAYEAVAALVRQSPERLVSSLIEEHFGRRISRIAQRIQATSLPASMAEALQAPADSPALRIVRRYLDAEDRVFEISVTWHPADRFTLSSVLERGRR